MSAAPHASSKPKITIFQHYDFKGNHYAINSSDPDINSMTPAGQRRGLSSFKVEQGTWSLYTEVNYGGPPLKLLGQTQFGPGDYDLRALGGEEFNDTVQSIKLIPHITLYSQWKTAAGETDLNDSNPDITKRFPINNKRGLSAFTVHTGKWSFYTEANYQGEPVNIDGTTVFEQHPRRKLEDPYNDAVVSIKLVEAP